VTDETELTRLRLENASLHQERETLQQAVETLCIDANRLCDRNLGGTYEEDCRRSITVARAALRTTAEQERATRQASPELAFQAWIDSRARLRGGPFTKDEYLLAQSAFLAAHPGTGSSVAQDSTQLPAPPISEGDSGQ